jgi:ABC-type Na+ efflux pump permease subunit
LFDNKKILQKDMRASFNDKETIMRPIFVVLALLLAGSTIAPALAASSTSKGQISVAQVMEMATRAQSDAAARTTVIAYLAGIGETTGLMVSEAQARGAAPVHCTGAFNLDESVAIAALSAAVPDQALWTKTAATPILIADMFSRGGCR